MFDGLSYIRKERKIVQLDAQMLSNRINFLKNENEKTWKKVKATRRKVQKLAEIKNDNEERLYSIQEARIENERALSEKRSNYKQIREKRQRDKSEIRSALKSYKQEEAINLRKLRENDLTRLKSDLDQQKFKNLQRKESVFQNKILGKAKILDFHHKKLLSARNQYWCKIEENEKLLHETQNQVSYMEQLEQELLKNLQNTQQLQHRAFADLSTMMNSPKLSSILSNRKNSSFF